MNETEVVTAAKRPSSFRMELHVDPSDENEEDGTPLTTKSWRVQLLRLLQRAPQPIPVLCDQIRAFPHVGNASQISDSSWTSDTTHSTDVTVDSRSLGSTINENGNGTEEIHQIAAVSLGDDDELYEKASFTTTANTTNIVDECGGSSPRNVDVGIEIFERKVGVNRKNEVGKKLSTCLSFPNGDSNGKLHVDRRKNQLHRLKDETSCRGSRKTLSLSIHGDSEYWEKFRYSKDYQSSLMIETICNEVFNLKPSSRYKSLVKLSETDIQKDMSKDRKESGEGEIGSPPQLTGEVECDDSNDETGSKMETAAEKENGEDIKGVKSKSTSPLGIQSEREENDRKGKVENVRSFLEKQHEQTEDSKVKDEERRNDERKSRNNSTTSSVYTATTQDSSENDRRRRESLLLFDGFGQSFHGYLTKHETEKLLQNEGQYLIRQMVDEDGFILSLMFDGKIMNYRLLWDVEYKSITGSSTDLPENIATCKFYLEDRRKCYHSLDAVVREGLITLHLDENAGSYVDLLMELAQYQRNDNLLQSPTAGATISRKTSRSTSFRIAKLPSASSGIGVSGGLDGNDNRSSSNTDGKISTDIALLIHFFEDYIFDSFAKCQVCANGIWGSSNKGLRCRDCCHSVHESCIDKVTSECLPDLSTLSPFSTDLTTLVKGSRQNTTNHSYGPPYLLEKCINELEARGLMAEGIYRICGCVEDIEKLKSTFEQEKMNANLSDHPDIHSITGFIKFFLRQLPEPLIPQDVFDEFTKDQSNIDQMKIDAVQTLVYCLPPAHRLTLQYFLAHLQRVTMEKAVNKMNAFNLSSVLMPSILCPENMFVTLESGTKLLHFMITHVQDIF